MVFNPNFCIFLRFNLPYGFETLKCARLKTTNFVSAEMNFGNIFVGQLVKHWRFSLSDSIKSQVQTKIIFFKQIAFFIDPNGRGTFVWFGLYSVNVHRNRLFYVFDHKWLVNIFFFNFVNSVKNVSKIICSFGLWRESNTPDFELWQKNVISVRFYNLNFLQNFFKLKKTAWSSNESK